MLIEAPMKAGDTVTIKTINGDEIIARLADITTTEYKILKPLAIMATPQGLGLGPFAFTVNPETAILINKSAVVFIAKTDSDMAKQYINNTSSLKVV